jgi:lipopolysaccharide transport system permease protein
VETIIRPRKWARLDWRELWAYRELFYFFAWRDIKVRYKQTAIGASWAIVQPFVTMVVFTIFFNRISGIKSGALPYAIFSYTGLIFWNLFAQTLQRSSESLTQNQSMITKVYFPRVIAPVSAAFVAIADFFFALLVYVVLMAYYGIRPGFVGVLLVLPLVVATFVASCGLGMFLASLNVKYRDVRQALPFFIQTLLFLTPVIYPVTLVPERFRWFLYLNPMTGIISVARTQLLHEGATDWPLVALSLAVGAALFALGLVYFRRRESEIADIV